MIVLAIDPGSEKSAWLSYETKQNIILNKDILSNLDLIKYLLEMKNDIDILAIEFVESFGMPVGKSVFETCFWAGRFVEAFKGKTIRIYRREVKMRLCGSMRAKDANIRQAIIDRYGGDRSIAFGTKKQPGPLYGVVKDIMSALAVAITCAETKLTNTE